MPIEFTYQKDSPRLEKILQSIDRPGEFCTYGRLSVPMPRLEAENIGILSFPVPELQIEQLIGTAEQAPYGKGTQTLVDTAVRNCWEINADQLCLGGRSWKKTMRELVRSAADGLGCPRDQLKAELYKLLIYQPGGFFIPHRDTEKSDGMIATLTISLPAAGTGGELVVRHKDRDSKIEMNVDDPSELAYAAFYADCEHEVKKIRSGHRIALVFNLLIELEGNEKFLTAPDYTDEIDAIAQELQTWCNKEDAANKLIWVLEHSYSEAGLSFETLKNGDRAVAGALAMASEQAECELFASIVHISEYFNAWYVGDAFSHYDEFADDDLTDYEIGELIESDFWMDSWSSPDGRNPGFRKLRINDFELMPAGGLDHALPDVEQVNEATGNAGATLERAYHYAALVLIRRAAILDELAKYSALSAVSWVAEELKRNDGFASDNIIELAQNLIRVWPGIHSFRREAGFSEIFQLILKLGVPRVSKEFLLEVASLDYTGDENDQVAAVLSTLSAADTKEILLKLINQKLPSCPSGLLELLVLLERKTDYSDSSKQRIFKACVNEIFRMLPQTLSDSKEHPGHRYKTKYTAIRKKTIENLFLLFWRADAMDLAISVPEVFRKFPKSASLDREVPKALVKLREVSEVFHSEAYLSLWSASAGYLLDRSETPPEEPKDWKVVAKFTCRTPQCNELRRFCQNPEQRVARFQLKQGLRDHLQHLIRENQLEIDHETETKGRPYTLVCTKNRATYKRRLEEYSGDVKQMKSLIGIMDGVEKSHEIDEDFVRLCAAVELGNAGELN